MNPLDHPADSDVLKIKAKVREARFSAHTFGPWLKWGAILGMLLGVLLGMLSWWSRSLPPGRIYFALDPLGELFVWVLGGVVMGCFFSAFIYWPIHFLRPIYVALFRDAAQFEREYGSTPERIRKSL